MAAMVRMLSRITSKSPISNLDDEDLAKVKADCDLAIVRLVNERAKIAALIEERMGPGDGVPSAELKVEEIDRIAEANASIGGPLKESSTRSIFQEISRVTSQLRHTVAFLGPMATFTHQAARCRFGINANYIQCERINDIFTAVEKGTSEFGLAPVENSTEGAVSQTLDLLATSELQVVAEVCVEIRHNLLSRSELSKVQRVYSHPQALAQCRQWLDSNTPGAEVIAESSTAKAAQLAAASLPEEGIAAISSLLASEIYSVPVRATSIQDLSSNMTRFVVLRKPNSNGKPESEPTGDDKTMLVLATTDRVGALHDVLNAFKQRGVNLARIESRPSKSKAWEYIFFVDMHGHWVDTNIREVMEELKDHCSSVRVLGSFPFVRRATNTPVMPSV
eukprot:CAMPEP_0174932508 /NCGR_PEP_ID=MMETSP1355-20121228/35738_1 /TAXON_ID=464990 /ORGANISM="Hemiselmis tepida, Strain CCMP443" /LENGTH=392 /DNA_ID=CAMNT_0016178923 /DNA_START=44 /DNA_END=1218 /DNA_ORIENTATION=+